MSEMSMDDILSDKPTERPPEKAPEAAPPAALESSEPAPPEPVERPQSRKQRHQEKEFNAQGLVRDPDTGQFAKKDAAPQEPKPDAGATTVAAPPAAPAAAAPPAQPDMTPRERAAFSAAADERRKRQELEHRIATMEAGKAAEPPKTFWDDPEGALRDQEARLRDVVTQTRMTTAESIARSKYPDFDEKIGVFAEVMKTTPGVYQQWMQAPDPAEYAYRLGKNQQELQSVGSIDALKAKWTQETEARVRAQIEGELKAKAEKAAAERAALPPSLSDARGTQGNKAVWNGPMSFDTILKG